MTNTQLHVERDDRIVRLRWTVAGRSVPEREVPLAVRLECLRESMARLERPLSPIVEPVTVSGWYLAESGDYTRVAMPSPGHTVMTHTVSDPRLYDAISLAHESAAHDQRYG